MGAIMEERASAEDRARAVVGDAWPERPGEAAIAAAIREAVEEERRLWLRRAAALMGQAALSPGFGPWPN